MGAWLFMLGGLIVWALHFLGVYAIASVADVAARADAPAALWLTGALTVACALANLLLLGAAWRRARRQADEVRSFGASLAGLGAGLSFVAVLWQGLPAVLAS